MNIQEPYRINNIDFNQIVYPKIKVSNNKKIILLKYNENGKLRNFVFQTPTLLNLFKSENHNGYHEIEVALIGKEEGKINKFIDFITQFENRIKKDAQYNAYSWFKLNNNNQTINFQKVIRESENYPKGTIKLKIFKNNDFETVLQLNNSKRININSIPENSWCKMILEAYAIWVNDSNDFGIFFRPILISFTPKEVYNYKFIDSDDENEFDIPDTEVNDNIFLKIENTNYNSNDSTSQLVFNEPKPEGVEATLSSIKILDEHSEEVKQINLELEKHLNNKDILEINLTNTYDSDTESSDDENDKLPINI
jgi:hypothetical protein